MDENSKLRTVPKLKDRRQPYRPNNESQLKSINKNQESFKADRSQIERNTSPVTKVLHETNKIVKLDMAKDFTLQEKNSAIQSSNETIDNLRKNILQLQMEYEKLDQNYQREISCRTELVKRMDATQSIIESTVHCSNILAKSIKQLENDKLKVAEFYELIYHGQKEIEEKHTKIEKYFNELDDLINVKFTEVKTAQEKIASQDSKNFCDLNEKLIHTNNKLKATANENENLLKQLTEFKFIIENLNMTIENKQKIINFQSINLNAFKANLKSLKIKKLRYQNLWKKKKGEISHVKQKNKQVAKTLSSFKAKQIELLTANKDLELNINQISAQLNNHLEQFKNEKKKWETDREEKMKIICEKEKEAKEATIEKQNLNEKILELIKRDEEEKVKWNKFQENYNKIYNENQELIGSNNELNAENDRKTQLILDFESKLRIYDNDINAEIANYKVELQSHKEMIKALESQLRTAEEKLSVEGNQREKLISEYEARLRQDKKLTSKEIILLKEKIEEQAGVVKDLNTKIQDKSTTINKLEAEIKNMFNGDSEKGKIIDQLKEDCLNKEERIEEIKATLRDYMQLNEGLQKEVDSAIAQIRELNEKIKEERAINNNIKAEKSRLENDILNLNKEIDNNKKSTDQLKQLNKELNEEICDLKKKAQEENSALKNSMTELQGLLDSTEAKVEACKVVIKKLETEKADCRKNCTQEIARLKLELTILHNKIKKDEDYLKSADTCQNTFQEVLEKENNMADFAKSRAGSTTPLQNNRKFLSTPRKVLTSTPLSKLHNSTPTRKKRDPYEFDSDGSVERFDADQVLKAFSSRSKKETKRPKTKNIN